jgi:cyclic di-GMP phosphodiesterase
MNGKQNGGTPAVSILIVEGDMPSATMMVHLLSQTGCDVLVANTGEKGMVLAHENKFDLIIVNVDLPDIGGFEICSELKQRHHSRHTPIVVIAMRPSEKDRQHGLELGAVDYIVKPFEGSEFAPRIFSHITRRASNAYMDNEVPVES